MLPKSQGDFCFPVSIKERSLSPLKINAVEAKIPTKFIFTADPLFRWEGRPWNPSWFPDDACR